MTKKQQETILVTGGTGFTGSHLVKRLLSQGHVVRVLDNQRGLFYSELEGLGADITQGSITDTKLVEQLIQGCTIVYHLAAAFRKINDPKEEYWNVNVNGTRNLAEASLKQEVKRFVYCSTQGVHGHIKTPPGNESSPITPADYYQYTKYQGEIVVNEFAKQGLSIVILRPTAIYGPGDPGRWLILFRQVSKSRFLMFGNGKTNYHPLYIDNLIDAFELAVEKESAIGGTYIIGDNHYYSLNEIVEHVGEALGKKTQMVHLPFIPLWLLALATEILYKPLNISPPLFRRRVDWFRQNRAFDISKAKRELGYHPRVDFPTGLRCTSKWYLENKFLSAHQSKTSL
jgi:nucleoside-diphosphate-sugar epimerase